MDRLFLKQRPLPRLVALIALTLVASFCLSAPSLASAQVASSIGRQISHDPFTNSTSQHQTQVEPDTFSVGSTVVSAFQSGRFELGGGASGISWATSFDAGRTWIGGVLPNMTIYNGGFYARVSDAVVAYDQAHHTWIISSLAAKTTFDGVTGSTVVVVSRSTNGLTWSNPVTVAASNDSQNFDKDWIVCDQHAGSRFFGRCYMQWNDGAVAPWPTLMSYSDNGGLTWSAPNGLANQSFFAQGGQPLVQPNGNVIVPIYGFDSNGVENIYSYRSIDGGASWTDPMIISPLKYSTTVSQFYRGGSLPSAEIDQTGKVYVAWAGCYFEANCTTDDIVFTTTTDGLTWTPLQRIPLDTIGSNVEHLTAGISVDSSTSGQTAHLAVAYYYWANAGCTAETCQVYVGMATSVNGGTTWSQHQTVGGPTVPVWWAHTDAGYMTGDYISSSIASNRAVTAVPVAQAPNNGQFLQFMIGASIPVTGGSLPSDGLSPTTLSPQITSTGTTPGKMQYPAN
ncbi:MAG TPA: sialidase family protein [Ktedonobacteraceae bacterium]|nr:sialidase family protein [Ktedonobacteraceae bacterium]